jgi:hypothetical protein
MITRTAVFEGTLKKGTEERFFAAVKEQLMPLWKRFPHARNVRMLRVTGRDENAPPILMIQQIDYPSIAALEEALASPVRTESRAVTMELMQMFEGRLYHIVSELDT